MLLAGAALVVLGVVFVAVGLNEASEISGVIGAVVGVAGLGLSAYGIVLARRPPQPGAGSQVCRAPFWGTTSRSGGPVT